METLFTNRANNYFHPPAAWPNRRRPSPSNPPAPPPDLFEPEQREAIVKADIPTRPIARSIDTSADDERENRLKLRAVKAEIANLKAVQYQNENQQEEASKDIRIK